MANVMRIYAGGRAKGSLFQAAFDHYLKQMKRWRLEIIEISEGGWLKIKPHPQEHWITLCERSLPVDSPAFSHRMALWCDQITVPCFIIGTADGIPDHIRKAAKDGFSLGSMTWPHLLARLLLIEQIYRAQQRLARHPYSFI